MHLWFSLDHGFSTALRSRTLLSASTVTQSRDASGSDEHRFGSVHSDNRFRFLDLKQDWSWSLSDRQLPRWGFNLGSHHGDYDYALNTLTFDPLITPVPVAIVHGTQVQVDLRKVGLYGAWRTRLTPAMTVEGGLHRDKYRYDGGPDFDVVSPRLNLLYAFDQRNELRVAWGIVYQPQAVNELQVEDDVTRFFAPERVRQAVLGYTRHFAHGLSARIDIYDKSYDHLRPRFENALDPVQLIPEGAPDRVRIDAPVARARGVELTLRREADHGLSGWLSLAFARAEERDSGVWTARSWEQRRALSFGGSWTGARWNLSLAGLMHSGSPITSIGIETTPLPGGGYDVQADVGARNGERLGSYARIDLRANRDVRLAGGKLSMNVEVTNLLDRSNECCIDDYRVADGGMRPPTLEVDQSYWLPLLPSFGFQWEL